eukprot:6635032-Prymnesium_polylepis.2
MPVAVHWTAISGHPRPCNVYAQGLLVHCVVHGAVNGPGPWYGLMHLHPHTTRSAADATPDEAYARQRPSWRDLGVR